MEDHFADKKENMLVLPRDIVLKIVDQVTMQTCIQFLLSCQAYFSMLDLQLLSTVNKICYKDWYDFFATTKCCWRFYGHLGQLISTRSSYTGNAGTYFGNQITRLTNTFVFRMCVISRTNDFICGCRPLNNYQKNTLEINFNSRTFTTTISSQVAGPNIDSKVVNLPQKLLKGKNQKMPTFCRIIIRMVANYETNEIETYIDDCLVLTNRIDFVNNILYFYVILSDGHSLGWYPN